MATLVCSAGARNTLGPKNHHHHQNQLNSLHISFIFLIIYFKINSQMSVLINVCYKLMSVSSANFCGASFLNIKCTESSSSGVGSATATVSSSAESELSTAGDAGPRHRWQHALERVSLNCLETEQ